MGSVVEGVGATVAAATLNITDTLAKVWELGNGAIDFVVSNPVTVIMLVASLVPIGFSLLRQSKRSARA